MAAGPRSFRVGARPCSFRGLGASEDPDGAVGDVGEFVDDLVKEAISRPGPPDLAELEGGSEDDPAGALRVGGAFYGVRGEAAEDLIGGDGGARFCPQEGPVTKVGGKGIILSVSSDISAGPVRVLATFCCPWHAHGDDRRNLMTLPSAEEAIESRRDFRYRTVVEPHHGLHAPSGIIDVTSSSREAADATILSSTRTFALGYARQEGRPFTWAVWDGERLVGRGTEQPAGAAGDPIVGGDVTRCPECNQTVAVVNGVIQTHKRVQGGRGVQCSGSGRSV